MSRRRSDVEERMEAEELSLHAKRQRERDAIRRRWEVFSGDLVKYASETSSSPVVYWVRQVNRVVFALMRIKTTPGLPGAKWSAGMMGYYMELLQGLLDNAPNGTQALIPKVKEFVSTI